MTNVITNRNIHDLIYNYIENRNSLPRWLRMIPIGDWDVSRVTNMDNIFLGFDNFNEPLNNWDVSNVTTMQEMFNRCRRFNQPLDNWDVSRVRTMNSMFGGCTDFNQPLNNWNVSNVTNMEAMFARCTNFNQPLNNWDVSNVRNMYAIFFHCTNFNQPLNNWNVSNVTNMRSFFNLCINFNQPLNNWNVSNVTNMQNMFTECTNFNQDLSNWNVSRVRHIDNMFNGCRSLTINPGWQINQQSENVIRSIFLNTPLEGQLLETNLQPVIQPAARPAPQPVAPVARPAPQLPQGLAFEVHNAFAELDLQKFMTIVRRENNGASNFKDPNNVLEPVVSYINSSDTSLSQEQKTRYTRNIRGSIRQNVNAYITDHPEVKDNTLEVIQFVLSQEPNYKDLYIETFENECMGGYSSGNRQSCTKGMFERIYMANKGTIEGLCFEELQGTSAVATASATAASRPNACKPVYLELYSAFTPGADIDVNDIFQKWYNQFSYDAIPEETNPLRNLSVEARKQHFRDFVRQDQIITPHIWNNPEFQRKLEQSIQANNIIFETLSLDAGLGKRRRKRIKRRTVKHKKNQKKATMKRLKDNITRGKNKIIRKTRGRY
jgi:surface protein